MNGGNISDGPNGDSGNVTELTVKNVPEEVNEKLPAKGGLQKKLDELKFQYDELQLMWLQETTNLRAQMDYVREAAERSINGMRKQYENNVEELMRARAKFDKYLVRNQELEDKVDALQKELEDQNVGR